MANDPNARIDDLTRVRIWQSATAILDHGPRTGRQPGATGLALGYVQSGKTTSITALIAASADAGYRLIVTILGSTNLLLSQNADRIEHAIGIGVRSDYRWIAMRNPGGRVSASQLEDWLARNRTVLVSVLKHSGRIKALADVLEAAGTREIDSLVIDDEADQASLNTRVNQEDMSQTYSAIAALRRAIPRHMYVQYTATPYAPLLLEPEDPLV